MSFDFSFRAKDGPPKKTEGPYGKNIARVSDVLSTWNDDPEERLTDWAAGLGDFCDNGWRKTRSDLADGGTICHEGIHRFYGGPPEEMRHVSSKKVVAMGDCAMRNFHRWESANEVRPGLLEETIVHKSLPFGGTCDFKGLYNGVLTMLDWKTSGRISRKMKLQLAAYNILHKDKYKDEIKQWGIVRFDRSKDKYQVQIWDNLHEEEYVFMSLLTNHNMMTLRKGRKMSITLNRTEITDG